MIFFKIFLSSKRVFKRNWTLTSEPNFIWNKALKPNNCVNIPQRVWIELKTALILTLLNCLIFILCFYLFTSRIKVIKGQRNFHTIIIAVELFTLFPTWFSFSIKIFIPKSRAPVAQAVVHPTSKQEVRGSIPEPVPMEIF